MSESQSEISQLSPQPVWQFFDKICSIPHPSYHEKALVAYIVDWAQANHLDVRRDKTGNIFIRKPATPGMENRKGVVLQAHLDMVPQKNEETSHDFTQDPIKPYIDGEWVKARGTTLGADNGIGMATCLAVLASSDIKHGPIEVLLTMNEESGMEGAFGLQPGYLQGDILLNTDSEQEGEVYVGCAGGVDSMISYEIHRQAIPENDVTRKLILKGLKGGHSGCDIHLGRGNANKILARFLAEHAEALQMRLIDFTGGGLRNAIPREASVIVSIPESLSTALTSAFESFITLIKQELSKVEENISAEIKHIESTEIKKQAFDTHTQQRFIATLNACPNGVIRMSDDIPGVVETSLNIGIVATEENKVSIMGLIRSLIDSGRQQVESTLSSLAFLAAANIEFTGAYPGWKPDTESAIVKLFRAQYELLYGHKPNIMVIHAGLECGLFKKPYPNMDMLSFGPTIQSPHSPDEKVQIKTVAQFWEQMVAVLENIPEQQA